MLRPRPAESSYELGTRIYIYMYIYIRNENNINVHLFANAETATYTLKSELHNTLLKRYIIISKDTKPLEECA